MKEKSTATSRRRVPTLVSSFGNQSNCSCDVCVRFDLTANQCTPACTGNLPRCVTGGAGSYSCFPP
ncbi:MAG: hypothetical protein ACOZQL_00840 [Myxococcota bacterium]